MLYTTMYVLLIIIIVILVTVVIVVMIMVSGVNSSSRNHVTCLIIKNEYDLITLVNNFRFTHFLFLRHCSVIFRIQCRVESCHMICYSYIEI
jgi:hypothetical protein